MVDSHNPSADAAPITAPEPDPAASETPASPAADANAAAMANHVAAGSGTTPTAVIDSMTAALASKRSDLTASTVTPMGVAFAGVATTATTGLQKA